MIDLRPALLKFQQAPGESWLQHFYLEDAETGVQQNLSTYAIIAEIYENGALIDTLNESAGITISPDNLYFTLRKDWVSIVGGVLDPPLSDIALGIYEVKIWLQSADGVERSLVYMQVDVSDSATDSARLDSNTLLHKVLVQNGVVVGLNTISIMSLINRFKQGRLMRYSGNLSIDSTTRKVSTTGRVFVVAANTHIDTDPDILGTVQELTNWDSATTKGLHFILINETTKLFSVVYFANIINYNSNNHICVGIIGGDTNDILRHNISGDYILNGVQYPDFILNKINSTTLAGYGITDAVTKTVLSSFKQARIMRFSGNVSADSVTRKVSTTGKLFVITANTHYDNDPSNSGAVQALTNWDSTDSRGLHFILFNTSTLLFAVVRFDRISTYNTDNYVCVGIVGGDTNNILRHHISGDYILNGVQYPDFILNKINSTTLAGFGITDAVTKTAFNRYKQGRMMNWTGIPVIDTVSRKISTNGRVFIVTANSYIDTNNIQSLTDWDSTDSRGLHFILLNETTRLFSVVRFDKIGLYDSENHICVGICGGDNDRTIKHNISGDYMLDGVSYPIVRNIKFNDFCISDIGALDNQELITQYIHIIIKGQSLSMGWQAYFALTTQNYAGTYMIGDRVWISKGNNNAVSLSPLIGTFSDPVGESPAISATNSFKRLFDRYHRRGYQSDFIATNCGEGGRSIEMLSKNCTNGTTTANNLYQTEFIKTLNRAKLIADNAGKTISCPAIIFMQGEHNYTGSGLGITAGTEATRDKNAYKALLLKLKNDMQADLMSIYGQTSKPLFFLYQTAGSYINREDMSINMAQLEFFAENEDVILLNPTYQCPDYSGGHLTANGYRWYGEYIAKAMYFALIKGKRATSVLAKKVTITNSTTIEVDFYVPTAPLVFDTNTTPLQTSNGFKVRAAGVEKTISTTEIIGNKVIITLSSALVQGTTIEVAYAGLGRNGSGNLRDSDTWSSQYSYVDDSAMGYPPTYNPLDQNANTLYGKKYPMQNWCSNFYFSLTY